MANRRAVVLLSGGLDSTTVLAIAKAEGFDVRALSFQYGQRHSIELVGAKRIAAHYQVSEHLILPVDLRPIGGSALTADISVPKDRAFHEMNEIPITYVPARNTIFLAFALAWAEVMEASDIFIGVNALDYSGYPDCRPEFIAAFEALAKLATKAGTQDRKSLKIHTPLIHLTKAQIIARGFELHVDYSLTNSCYDPPGEGVGCGRCDSCLLRLKGFAEFGQPDPLRYQSMSMSHV